MFKSYLLIAWRNLARQKVLSFINVSGLSLGMACFSLFLLYALNEFSFDGFHRNAKDLYRAYDDNTTYKKQIAGGMPFTPMPLGPAPAGPAKWVCVKRSGAAKRVCAANFSQRHS